MNIPRISRIPELLDYLRLAIDDIERALRSHFVETKNVPLNEYGNIIRGFKKGSGTESTSLPIKLKLNKKNKVVQGIVYDLSSSTKITTTNKNTKLVNKFVVRDFTPIVCQIPGYQTIDLSMLTATLELEDDCYTQETIKEEI